MNAALTPSVSLLVKLGSMAVHADEMMSPSGHHFDVAALRSLIADEEVKEWLKQMQEMGFLPVKR